MGRHKPLPPPHVYARRLLRNAAWVSAFIAAALGIGVVGYHYFLALSWVDALLNASMILTGMGPVDPAKTDGAKIFASAYALFSGVFFLSATALLLAPVAQHLLHRFHLEMYGDDGAPLPPEPMKKSAPSKPAASKPALSKPAPSKPPSDRPADPAK